jgi:hypothetical protein
VGDPEAELLRLYSVTVLFLFYTWSMFFISSVTSAFTKLSLMSSDGHSYKLTKLRRYLKERQVPKNLTHRVQRAAERIIVEKRRMIAEDDVEVLKSLSGHLQAELQLEVTRAQIGRHDFVNMLFQCSAAAEKLSATAFTSQTLTRLEFLFKVAAAGMVTPQVFFLVRGQLKYNHDTEETFVQEGAVISEAALWSDWAHMGDMQGMTSCHLLILDVAQFQSVAKDYMLITENVRMYATEFVNGLNQKLLAGDQPSDLDCGDHLIQKRGSSARKRGSFMAHPFRRSSTASCRGFVIP